MKKSSTLDLSRGLMSEPNLDVYLAQNQSDFSDEDMTGFLNRLYQRIAVSKATLARQAGMSEVYLHQVFSGRRRPSRDRLLCLCICMDASLEEVQQVLKGGAYAPLYPRHKRDAIISHGILHGTALEKINEKLAQEQEQPLLPDKDPAPCGLGAGSSAFCGNYISCLPSWKALPTFSPSFR